LMAILFSAGREPVYDNILWGSLAATSATVDALVAARHPRNPIGWLVLCGAGVHGGLMEMLAGWGQLSADEGLPAGGGAEWFTSWAWTVNFAAWIVVLLLFPDGRLPGRRWRFALGSVATGLILAAPAQALSTHNGPIFASGHNPLGVDAPVVDVAFGGGMVLMLAALAAAIVSLVFRFRHSGSLERQQIKWMAYAAGALLLVTPFSALFYVEGNLAVQLAIVVALIGLPVAVGIAILRYRLYDIDVVINRTLVYGALTATLAGAYIGGVLVLQLALSGVTEGSGLAVAASTLGVAALFRPARGRIQEAVDRRFYRRKYDAAQTLARFGARLRDEVDIDALRAELRSVVADTMQPAHISVWLRAPRADS